MVNFTSGNLFDSNCEYLINTVNCEGVMGKGIALDFKKKYPDMFLDYVEKCKNGLVLPGIPYVWSNDNLFNSLRIINFPTKNEWKKPSNISFIETGLDWMVDYFKEKIDANIAVPPLGCGNGKLNWNKVKSLIYKKLQPLEAEFYVFEPGGNSLNQWGF